MVRNNDPGIDRLMLNIADEMQKALTELAEAAGEIAEIIDVVQCGRMQRLFDL